MRTNVKTFAVALLGVVAGLLVAGGSASAHHSYAMFNRTKLVTISGTVAKFDWRNPHIYIWVYVKNPSTGNQDLYAVESGSRNSLERRGWDSHTFEPDDKVTMDINPLRDGRTGGYFVKGVKADGVIVVGDPAAGPGDGKLPGFSGAGERTKQ